MRHEMPAGKIGRANCRPALPIDAGGNSEAPFTLYRTCRQRSVTCRRVASPSAQRFRKWVSVDALANAP